MYDLGATRPGSAQLVRIQVKTARSRIRDGQEWIVVNGTRNNGKIYTTDIVDAFIGVHQGVAYMFDNRGLTEYWCKPSELSEKWTRLDASIDNVGRAAVI